MGDACDSPRRRPARVVAAILVCMLAGAVLRFWNLNSRGLWEVDEATYALTGRAYVSLFHAIARAWREERDPLDPREMTELVADTFPMDYDFRYQFTRGPARMDVVMSGFRMWAKPTHIASVVAATAALGSDTARAVLFPSAIYGSLVVGVVGWAAWRLTATRSAAIGAAAWAAVSYPLIHYSRSGYGAMCWTLACAAVLLLAVPAWRRPPGDASWRRTLLRGACVGLALSVFYGLLPLVAIIAAIESVWILRGRPSPRRAAQVAGAWAGGAAGVLLAWQLVSVLRVWYLGGVLGFPNVYSYFGEILDQLTSEVELPRYTLAETMRFWAGNLLALEGAPACGAALLGIGAAAARARRGDVAAWGLLVIGGGWLLACSVARLHLGRVYTPLLPVFGLFLAFGLHVIAVREQVLAWAAACVIAVYGLWNVQPLLVVRSGLPTAARWIEAHGDPGRVAVATFGYNQLFRAELHREVFNPPTRAVLATVADTYVEVGPIATPFTPAALETQPIITFQDPPLQFAPARIDLGVHLDPFWRFRFGADDWARLRGREVNPRFVDLIRVYRVADLP